MPEQEVMQLFSKIKNEPGHYGVVLLDIGIEDDAVFTDWRMSFKTLENRCCKVQGLKLIDEINFF